MKKTFPLVVQHRKRLFVLAISVKKSWMTIFHDEMTIFIFLSSCRMAALEAENDDNDEMTTFSLLLYPCVFSFLALIPLLPLFFFCGCTKKGEISSLRHLGQNALPELALGATEVA